MALRSWVRFEWVRRLPYFRCCAPHTEASAHPHGCQFAVDEIILETPGEPAHSTLKDRLYHGAYPTQEYGRIVFDYMGPPDRQLPFPVYDSFVRPGYRLMSGQKYFYPCNWLQIMENAMDAAHTAFLHTAGPYSPTNSEYCRNWSTDRGVARPTYVLRAASAHMDKEDET
jgi:phenylpropionate dioxygenase-like ring-hydroxylating dioxygenase large terminal subunit